MAKGIAAFVAGLGTGMVKGTQYRDEQERLAKKDALEAEERQLRMAPLRKEIAGDAALADAAKTAVAEPNITNDDDGSPSSAPAVRVVGPGPVRNFSDQGAAQAAAAATNAQPVSVRQIAALQGIDPERAQRMRASAATVRSAETQAAAAEAEMARKLREEGVFDALRALRAGDAAGIKAAANKAGQYKIVGDVQVTPVERDIPGYGKRVTYNASYTIKTPDGQQVVRNVNSHDLSMELMPYEKQLKVELDGTEAARKGRESDAQVKRDEAHARAYDATAKQRSAGPAPAAAAPAAPVWNDKADALLNRLYFGKDGEGNVAADSHGALFAKSLALGIAQQNGGDSYSALMQVHDIDRQLQATAREAASKLPAPQQPAAYEQALRKLRNDALKAARSPKAPPAPPPKPLSPAGRAVSAAPVGETVTVNLSTGEITYPQRAAVRGVDLAEQGLAGLVAP